MTRAFKATLWLLTMSFAVLLFAMTSRYFSFASDIHFLRVKQDVVHDLIWRSAFYLHIAAGMLAIVIGPLQLLPQLRQKMRAAHRLLGKVYITAILVVGAPTGFYMALYADGGPWAATGFALMSALWFYLTWMAFSFARERKFTEHSQWMIRSYALTFSAVTLRLFVPVSSLVFQLPPDRIVVLSAWVSWIINIVLAEFLIIADRRFKLRIAL